MQITKEGNTRLGGVKSPPKSKRPGPPKPEKPFREIGLEQLVDSLEKQKHELVILLAVLVNRLDSYIPVTVSKEELEAIGSTAANLWITYNPDDGSITLHNEFKIEIPNPSKKTEIKFEIDNSKQNKKWNQI